ncbi:hypothetical protein ACFWI9_33695, partial [Streptomyces sp. NPDC127084]
LAPIPDGQHTFTPTATNPQGSTTGQPVTVTITPPNKPHKPHNPYKPYSPYKPHKPGPWTLTAPR